MYHFLSEQAVSFYTPKIPALVHHLVRHLIRH